MKLTVDVDQMYRLKFNTFCRTYKKNLFSELLNTVTSLCSLYTPFYFNEVTEISLWCCDTLIIDVHIQWTPFIRLILGPAQSESVITE